MGELSGIVRKKTRGNYFAFTLEKPLICRKGMKTSFKKTYVSTYAFGRPPPPPTPHSYIFVCFWANPLIQPAPSGRTYFLNGPEHVQFYQNTN